jgi:hypothetical protein
MQLKGAANSTWTSPSIEAILMQSGNNGDPFGPVVEDTSNIQVGELVEFQVVQYDPLGGRHVIPAVSWRWDDKPDQFGTLDPNSGLFSVGQASMPSHFKVNATVASTGVSVGAYYLVNPYQARIIGQVIGSDTQRGMRGVEVDFFDSNQNEVDAVTTSYDGTFRASARLTAVQFTVNPDSIPSTYWQQFSYGQNPAFLTNPSSQQPTLLFDAGSSMCFTGFQTLYSRSGSQIGTTLAQGENFLFAPTQPSVLLQPVTPASSTDPNLIVISSKSTYQARPNSNGCTG